MKTPYQLRDIVESLRAGKTRRVKVRTLLAWFGHKRRGSSVVWTVRRALRTENLKTVPDFSTVGIDAFVTFSMVSEQLQNGITTFGATGRDDTDRNGTSESLTTDPALHIGMLPTATRGVVTVRRDDTVSEAVTKMMYHNYSQLPVTQDLRRIDGIISWRSIGVSRNRIQDQKCDLVRDCLDNKYSTVDLDTPLLDAVEKIIREEVVLVLGSDKRITGIVTTTDLSQKYHELAAPFLLLQEIEDRLRLLIDHTFSQQDIGSAKDPRDHTREIQEAADLTFGEYIRLLEARENWIRLELALDRRVFIRLLRDVKTVRNEIMHFSPDDLSSENLAKVEKLRRLLGQLS